MPPAPPEPTEPSPFFEEQLTAFEVWLRFGAGAVAKPEQLPVVLQVLLSQAHRVRALVLLRRFLELGPRAVDVALCVGIFPYVLKLLQSPAPELRRPLVAIWAAILAFDGSCRSDLARDGAPALGVHDDPAPLDGPPVRAAVRGDGDAVERRRPGIIDSLVRGARQAGRGARLDDEGRRVAALDP